MQWLWESYQISSELYKEVDANSNIDETYYNKWIPVIHKRINQAGVRSAGELNRIFKDQHVKITKITLSPPPPIHEPPVPPMPVLLKEVKDFIGQNVKVQGKAYGMKDVGSIILVNVGAAYPDQLLTVVLKGDCMKLASEIENQIVSITGKVIEYKGKPEIVVTGSNQLLNNR